MSDDNTQDAAEPSPASAGSRPFPKVSPERLLEILRMNCESGDILCGDAADEIERLLLTDAERESLRFCIRVALPETEKLGGVAGELCRMHRDRLRGLLERLG